MRQPSPSSSNSLSSSSSSTSSAPAVGGAFATLVATFSVVCERVFRAQLPSDRHAQATSVGGAALAPPDELELVRTAFMFTAATRHQILSQHERPILYA